MFDRQQSIVQARAVDISSTDDSFPTNMPTRAIYVGTTGNLVVEFAHNPGVSVTYNNIPVGRHVLRLSKVIRSGTTASNLVAEF
jgi:hypothetical protein